MYKNTYSASAPGSIMLMGEHAVLRNKLALVGAVDKRITVTLTPQNNEQVDIYSELGEYHSTLHQLESSPIFHFVITALRFYQEKIPTGFRLDIHSEFSSTVGLGSSAAVVVATLTSLQTWTSSPSLLPGEHSEEKYFLHQLFLDARTIIQEVQGRGSGADVVASVYGGIVAYRMDPIFIEKSTNIPNIALVYTGFKTPTPEVIKIVDQYIESDPQTYTKIFDQMNYYSEQAWKTIQQKNWIKLGALMQDHQHAQAQLGVCDKKTAALLTLLQENTDVLGCKISGSGLGDCVVALIKSGFHWDHQDFAKIDSTLSERGVIYEC